MQILKEKHLRFYEEYDSPQAKRKAQKGAKRGKRTNKAMMYLCDIGNTFLAKDQVFCNEVLSNIRKNNKPCLILNSASIEYIWKNCRRIAKSEVPLEWMQAFNLYFEKN